MVVVLAGEVGPVMLVVHAGEVEPPVLEVGGVSLSQTNPAKNI